MTCKRLTAGLFGYQRCSGTPCSCWCPARRCACCCRACAAYHLGAPPLGALQGVLPPSVRCRAAAGTGTIGLCHCGCVNHVGFSNCLYFGCCRKSCASLVRGTAAQPNASWPAPCPAQTAAPPRPSPPLLPCSLSIPTHFPTLVVCSRRTAAACAAGPLATPSAQQLTHQLYGLLRPLAFCAPLPLSLTSQQDACGECCAIQRFLQAFVGTAVPLAWQAIAESRLFERHQVRSGWAGLQGDRT